VAAVLQCDGDCLETVGLEEEKENMRRATARSWPSYFLWDLGSRTTKRTFMRHRRKQEAKDEGLEDFLESPVSKLM
jgi:hypothetical protein